MPNKQMRSQSLPPIPTRNSSFQTSSSLPFGFTSRARPAQPSVVPRRTSGSLPRISVRDLNAKGWPSLNPMPLRPTATGTDGLNDRRTIGHVCCPLAGTGARSSKAF